MKAPYCLSDHLRQATTWPAVQPALVTSTPWLREPASRWRNQIERFKAVNCRWAQAFNSAWETKTAHAKAKKRLVTSLLGNIKCWCPCTILIIGVLVPLYLAPHTGTSLGQRNIPQCFTQAGNAQAKSCAGWNTKQNCNSAAHSVHIGKYYVSCRLSTKLKLRSDGEEISVAAEPSDAHAPTR
jgi:hypothetical protein